MYTRIIDLLIIQIMSSQMDSTVATGAASMMAIRVLLDHDVPEENIYFGRDLFPFLLLKIKI